MSKKRYKLHLRATLQGMLKGDSLDFTDEEATEATIRTTCHVCGKEKFKVKQTNGVTTVTKIK